MTTTVRSKMTKQESHWLKMHTRACKICGKSFFIAEFGEYAYRIGENNFYCSYTCFRVAEKARLRKIKEKLKMEVSSCTRT